MPCTVDSHCDSGSIYRSAEVGDRIWKKIASEGACECCYMNSVLNYIGKGLSTLKEHPKSKPHADQKSRQGCQIMDLNLVEALYSLCLSLLNWMSSACMLASFVTYRVDAGLPSALGQSTTSPMLPLL